MDGDPSADNHDAYAARDPNDRPFGPTRCLSRSLSLQPNRTMANNQAWGNTAIPARLRLGSGRREPLFRGRLYRWHENRGGCRGTGHL